MRLSLYHPLSRSLVLSNSIFSSSLLSNSRIHTKTFHSSDHTFSTPRSHLKQTPLFQSHWQIQKFRFFSDNVNVNTNVSKPPPNQTATSPEPVSSKPSSSIEGGFAQLQKIVEEDKRQKFWEFWTEESEAIKEGKEYIPKPIPLPKDTSINIWKILALVFFIDCIITSFRERQIDEKEMASLAEKKLEEVFERIKPFVILEGADHLPSNVMLKLESRRWNIQAEDRYLNIDYKIYEDRPNWFSFTLSERCFSTSGTLNINILKNNEKGGFEDLDIPMKCWVTIQRSGRTVRLQNLTIEFLKGGKKVTIPTEFKPTSEGSFHLVTVPFKV